MRAVLAGPIGHVVNFSLLSEAVPSSFKDARVTPLFKKGSRLDPSNYSQYFKCCVEGS